VPVAGFTTGELRTGGHREGFVVEAVSGAREFWPTSIFRVRPGWAGTVWTWPPWSGSGCRRWATPGPAGWWLSTSWARWSLPRPPSVRRSWICWGGMWPWWPTVHQTRDRFTDGLRRRPDIRVIRITEALPETAHNFRLDLIVPVRRSSAAAAPDGPTGSSGSTWMRPRSPPFPALAARTRQDRTLQP
jgi:hypothetical protein